MGAICDYVPMGNNPAQGGYLIMASGTFWITGLNTDNPMAITILTYEDAANLITPLGGNGKVEFGRGTCRTDGILYVLASDTDLFSRDFVLKRMPDNTWSAVSLGQIGSVFYNGPDAKIINGYTTNNHIWIEINQPPHRIYYSNDGAQTWNQIASITGSNNWNPVNIYLPDNISWGDIPIFVPDNNNTSTTWAFVKANNTFSQMDYISIQYNSEYFGGYEYLYYRHMITAQASNPNNMVAMLGGYNHKSDAYIFTSSNGGTSWTYKTVIPKYVQQTGYEPENANNITIHPYNSNYLFVVANGGF